MQARSVTCSAELRARGRGERGDTAPERERATSNTAVHKTRTARAEGSLVEGEELVRRDHCRGGARGVDVASRIARVQVVEHKGAALVIIVSSIGRGAAEDYRGRREAPVGEARVDARELGIHSYVRDARVHGSGSDDHYEPA